MFLMQFAFAQEKTITGNVTDDKGLPLPGVNIVILGTTNGTQTDFDGNYSIVSNKGAVISFSYVGFSKKEIAIGDSNTINVGLEEVAGELEEVVVVAQGVKSKQRSLSYAIATVGNKDIENTGEVNIVSALTSKAPGVSVINSSGSVGASANIRIRGSSSFIKSNSPLFIVDGVPVDNKSTGSSNDTGNTSGTDFSNRAIDINQNDIASISILKGVAAQTLYGLRAANGVVIITTKKGKSGAPRVSVSSTLQVSEVNKLPELQDQYSQGVVLNGKYTYSGPQNNTAQSWGPKISSLEFDGNTAYAFDRNGALVPKGTGNGVAAKAYDQYDFFVKGLLTDLNASVRGGSDKMTYYISGGKLDQSGVAPTENFSKKSFRADVNAEITKKLEIGVSGAFVNSGGKRVQRGSNTSGIMLGLLRTTPTFDNGNGLKGNAAANTVSSYQKTDGSGKQRSYRDGVYDNPYWTVTKNPSIDNVNRFTGRLSFEYNPNNWLTLNGKYTYDRYSDIRKASFDINSAGKLIGSVFDDNIFKEDITASLIAMINTNISEKITFNGLIGAEKYSTDYLRRNVLGEGLTIPGFFDLSNTANQINKNFVERKKTDGVFANAKIGYDNFWFLDTSVRNDYSSTLPKDNNSFASYSVGTTFVFSEFFESTIFNYGKLRASYGRIGNDAPMYATKTFYDAGSVDGDGFISPANAFPLLSTVGFERYFISGNNSLRPEVTTEMEFGGEFKFLNSRISLDVAYYDKTTTDQVIDVNIAPSSGFSSRYINSGKVENKGVELAARFVPIQNDNFTWNIDANWSTNTTKVVTIAPGLSSYFLNGFSSTSSRIIEGESYGVIYGEKWKRDDKGNRLIDNDGYPIVDSESGVIGNPIPDWTMGITNSFSYKNISLSFLLDIRKGGDVWCGTCGIIDYFGTSKETGDLRDKSTVFQGVVEKTGEPNTKEVKFVDFSKERDDAAYWTRNGFGGVAEDYVYDSSWVRLREVSLSYNFGDKIIKSTPLTSASITFSGRNLWLLTDYKGVDPETNLTGDTNGSGLDYFNQPNTKSYAISLKLNF